MGNECSGGEVDEVVRCRRHATAGKANSRVFAAGIYVLESAVLLHDPHWAHRGRKWIGSVVGDVVPRIRRARDVQAIRN